MCTILFVQCIPDILIRISNLLSHSSSLNISEYLSPYYLYFDFIIVTWLLFTSFHTLNKLKSLVFLQSSLTHLLILKGRIPSPSCPLAPLTLHPHSCIWTPVYHFTLTLHLAFTVNSLIMFHLPPLRMDCHVPHSLSPSYSTSSTVSLPPRVLYSKSTIESIASQLLSYSLTLQSISFIIETRSLVLKANLSSIFLFFFFLLLLQLCLFLNCSMKICTYFPQFLIYYSLQHLTFFFVALYLPIYCISISSLIRTCSIMLLSLSVLISSSLHPSWCVPHSWILSSFSHSYTFLHRCL